MKKKILLVNQRLSGFVKSDLRILGIDHDVRNYVFRLEGWPWKVREARKLFQAMRDCDLVFCWFIDEYSVLAAFYAKLLGKKSILIAGGATAEWFPEINYGELNNKATMWRASFSVRHSDKVLMFSGFSREHFQTILDLPCDMLHLGIDADRFSPDGEKEDLVLTVGDVSQMNLRRKGLLAFVKAAAYLPTIPFVMAGRHFDDSIDMLREIATPNVSFTGEVGHQELLSLYRRAKVYVQPSYIEGFGVSNAEAMACECVPVVTKRGSLIELVGDTAIFVEENDPEDTARGIREALDRPDMGKVARQWIVETFSEDKRRRELDHIIQEIFEE